ncbi:Phage antitermination protein Q [Morganella morganii]|uniref:antiterminator Q family protein n=1 Tax=Morganella morganii TaxID=582 RepID=UPI000907299A|nr:antiterminator Q family protein [Morganella morganii]STZ19248.1 Phage antitermination protein Q [Morganella morganii]
MSRDIQTILLHWGGWAAGGHCAGMGWARVSSGFRELAQNSSKQRPSCSDEDGRVIDRCVSMLGTAGLERERDYITDYYVKGMSKRAIGRKYKVREDEIRKQVQSADESPNDFGKNH